MNYLRVIAAFAIAPLAPALVAYIFSRNIEAFIAWSVFTYPFAVALGVPAFLAFRRLGWLHIWQIVLGAAPLGVISCVVGHFTIGSALTIPSAAVFTGCAAMVGLVFAVIGFAGAPAHGPQSSN